MKKLFKIVLISSLTLLCFSCYYDEFLEEEEIIIDPEEVVSFATDIIPIFESNNCSQCHNASRDPDLRAGNEYNSLVPDYVTPGDLSGSILYNKLVINNHRELNANELAYIIEWIEGGAENN